MKFSNRLFSAISCSVNRLCVGNNLTGNVLTKSAETELVVGSKISVTRRFGMEDVKSFAALSGDFNPIHLNSDFAKNTKFKKPILHGMLSNSLFSGLLAKQFGDGAILLSLECKYLAPAYVDEEIIAEAEIKDISGIRVTTSLKCYRKEDKKVIVEGSAKAMLPRPLVDKKQTKQDV